MLILRDLRDSTNTFKKLAEKYDVSPTYISNLFDKKVDIRRGLLPQDYRYTTRTGMKLSKYQIVDYMLDLDDELKKAYYLKEEYREFNLCIDNPEDAALKLEDLILKFKRSGISEYVPFWKLLQNWKKEIINSFTRINGFRISNGPIEKVNSEIRKLIKVSYGCSNSIRFKNRVMYVINDNESILGTKKKHTNKREFKPRGKYKK